MTTTDVTRTYPIGTPGQPWTEVEKKQWFEAKNVTQRTYQKEVLDKLVTLEGFTVEQYGSLTLDPPRYPLNIVKSSPVVRDAPWVLVTGGVHGYETSGVQGALAFLTTAAPAYFGRVNIVVVPCISPWGYEVINRWNPATFDPNRNFKADSEAEECAAVMAAVKSLDVDFLMHIDLHETTDTDESEFSPALAARNGTVFEAGLIPDGFYTVGDSENPQPEFQAAIISSVRKVTHIAPPDDNNQIIGADVKQDGVIHYPFTALHLCGGMTSAKYTSTTEVYPDSPKATDAICNDAQVAAVTGGLDYALAHL